MYSSYKQRVALHPWAFPPHAFLHYHPRLFAASVHVTLNFLALRFSLFAWQHTRLSNSTGCGEEQQTVLALSPSYVHSSSFPASIFPHTHFLCTQTSTTTTMVMCSNKNKQLSEQALKQIEKKLCHQRGTTQSGKKKLIIQREVRVLH